MKKEDQNKIIAGRTYREVLDRFDMKIKDPRKTSTGKKNTNIIKKFLKIKCPLKKAPKNLNFFFKKNRINIVVGKGFFPLIKNKNLKVEFSAYNGKEVEFYSSMIFSVEVKIKSKFKNFISGGRYDHLTTNLGFRKVSAVGAAVNMNLYE